jgi:integrase
MCFTGCRVSEALAIRPNDITNSGRVMLIGLKKSENRLIDIPLLYDFLVKSKQKNIHPFHSMNRFTAYRYCKEFGVGILKKGRVHESITHAFREFYVKDLRSIKASNSDLARTIGHKSQKSTEYYGKD